MENRTLKVAMDCGSKEEEQDVEKYREESTILESRFPTTRTVAHDIERNIQHEQPSDDDIDPQSVDFCASGAVHGDHESPEFVTTSIAFFHDGTFVSTWFGLFFFPMHPTDIRILAHLSFLAMKSICTLF